MSGDSSASMSERLWVRRDDSALGPFEVAGVADPAGLAEIEPGWQEYVSAATAEKLRRDRDHYAALWAKTEGELEDLRSDRRTVTSS